MVSGDGVRQMLQLFFSRLMCGLSFHSLKTVEEVGTVEVVECQHCKRKWAVETERHQVHELRGAK